MSDTPPKRIGTLLVNSGLISQAQLNEALRIQRQNEGRLVQILVGLGYITSKQFIDFLSKHPGIPSIDISRYAVARELIELIPRDFSIRHEVFPLDRMGNLLTVGMVCPLDSAAIKELEALTGLKVKPLLVSPDDLRRSIERYYSHDDDDILRPHDVAPLNLAGTAYLVRNLDSLPTLPPTIQRIRAFMADLDVEISKLAAIINTDPPLAARILATANSPAYGFPNRVASVELAVSLMGLRETYNIAMSIAVADMFVESAVIDFKRFWAHSYLRAGVSKVIARYANHGDDPTPFTAGLLANIGRLAFAEVAPNKYRQIPRKVHGLERLAAEEEILGITHPEAGYLIAESWGFPTSLADAIRFHRAPERAKEGRIAAYCVAAADAYITLSADDQTDYESVDGACRPLLEPIGQKSPLDPAIMADLAKLSSETAVPVR